MRWRLPFLATVLLALAAPAAAQGVTVTEEWVTETGTASRYLSPLQQHTEQTAIAAYGPFRVIDAHTAALVDVTDAASPAQFTALLADFPQIDTLDFVEAPGTDDDRANLQLGRMIRARGIATRVADGGSIRSGAVELFVAGVSREIAAGSEFAVHGWLDDWGRGAQDYPADAPEHRRYLDYYAEMGMEVGEARAFYAMTNSVPFEQARWLTGSEMRDWLVDQSGTVVAQEAKPAPQPRLAYLDLAAALQ